MYTTNYYDDYLLEFPSPYEVLFILISIRFFDYPVVDYKEFPSPCGVSFILIGNNIRIINSHIFKEKFPSPYGVLFILMNSNFLFQDLRFGKGFPSPYGVLFILIYNKV